VALATSSNKKFKKGPKGGNKPKGEGKKDMRKVNFFACHKIGHYAGQCPNKKKKQTTTSAGVECFPPSLTRSFPWLCVYPRGPLIQILGILTVVPLTI
jgi:hypothetical protein